ncbi:hypothetical protein HYD86_00875 [Mycoplasmopsis bovis]|nr:hypothetical protein [Mycoplasmopsis bovis]QQH36807.1 hypothetical protein HYD86_00875 [Mycoplasmopsis bovis]
MKYSFSRTGAIKLDDSWLPFLGSLALSFGWFVFTLIITTTILLSLEDLSVFLYHFL